MIHSRFDFFCFAFSKNRCMSTLPLGLAPGKEWSPSPRSVSSRKTHATESLRSPLVRDSLPGTSLGTRPSNLWHWGQFFQSSHCLPSGRDSRTLPVGSEACSSRWEIHALVDQLQPLNQGLELSHPMKYEVYIMVNSYPVN